LELGEPEEAIERKRKNLKDFPLPAAVQVLQEADRLVPRNVNLPPAALSLLTAIIPEGCNKILYTDIIHN